MKSSDISSAFSTPRHLLVLLTFFERKAETVKQSLPATATDAGQFWGLLFSLYTALRSLGEKKTHGSAVIFGTAAHGEVSA